MAEVPVYTSKSTNVPSGTSFSISPTAPKSGLVLALEGAANIGKAWENELAKTAAQEDAVRSVKAEGEFELGLQEYAGTLDPTDPGYHQKLSDRAARLRDETAGKAGFALSKSSDDYQARTTQITTGFLRQGLAERQKTLVTDAIDARENAQNAALLGIQNDPDHPEAYLAKFSDQAARLNQGIPPHIREKLDGKFGDAAVSAQALGYAAQGRGDEARKLLNSAEGLSPQARAEALGKVSTMEAAARAELAREHAQVVADEQNLILAGGGSMERIDQMKAQGVFEQRPSSEAMLRSSLINRRRQEANDARQMAVAQATLAAAQERLVYERRKDAIEGINNPQKGIDEAVALGLLQGTYSTDFSTTEGKRLLALTTARGYLPKAIRHEMDAKSQSASPADQLDAFKMYQAIRGSNPNAPLPENPRLELMAGLAHLGMSEDQILSGANITLNRSQGEREDLNQQFNQKTADLNKNGSEEWIALAAKATGFDESAVSPQLLAEFRNATRTFYQLSGGNFEASAAAAGQRVLSQGWRPDALAPGQDPVARPASPTNLLKAGSPIAKNLDEATIRTAQGEALKTFMTRNNILPDPAPGDEKKDPWAVSETGVPPYDLVADDVTTRQMKAGQAPEYLLYRRNEYGVLSPAMDARGNYIRLPLMDEKTLGAQPSVAKILRANEVEGLKARIRELGRQAGAIQQVTKGTGRGPGRALTEEEAARLADLNAQIRVLKRDAAPGNEQ